MATCSQKLCSMSLLDMKNERSAWIDLFGHIFCRSCGDAIVASFNSDNISSCPLCPKESFVSQLQKIVFGNVKTLVSFPCNLAQSFPNAREANEITACVLGYLGKDYEKLQDSYEALYREVENLRRENDDLTSLLDDASELSDEEEVSHGAHEGNLTENSRPCKQRRCNSV